MEQNIGKCGSNTAMCASEPAARDLLALGDTFGNTRLRPTGVL
jgi:hypothetical protein